MNIGIDANAIHSITGVFSLFPQVDEVILYGSRAKGNFKEGSDIDLTLKGKAIDLEVLNSISSKLYDLPLPYMFDLSVFEQIENPELLEHIKRVGRVFYKRQ